MNYIEEAKKTDLIESDYELMVARVSFNEKPKLLHAAMGMVTESAEFMDALKKHFIYGKPIDEVNLIEELGDVCWYIAIACKALGTDFESIQRINIEKLRRRFPGKFTEEAALNRDLDAERAVLEGNV